MDLLDGTVVNVALPTVQRELHADATDVRWIVSGYMLAFAATLITAGRLSDLFGRRRLFLAGVASFGVASLLSGIAQPRANSSRAASSQGVMLRSAHLRCSRRSGLCSRASSAPRSSGCPARSPASRQPWVSPSGAYSLKPTSSASAGGRGRRCRLSVTVHHLARPDAGCARRPRSGPESRHVGQTCGRGRPGCSTSHLDVTPRGAPRRDRGYRSRPPSCSLPT